jgi:membrane protein implicated in regulation of membrane protease activity
MKTRPPLWYTLQAVLSWILEEALLAAVVLWLLPHYFNIHIPLWGLAILMLASAAFSGSLYSAGRRTFSLRARVAADDLIGSEGVVTKQLSPQGYIKVQGVLWKAICLESNLEVGYRVEVTGIMGLKLVVKPKK